MAMSEPILTAFGTPLTWHWHISLDRSSGSRFFSGHKTGDKAVYVANATSYLFRQFFENGDGYSVDATKIHDIIKETVNEEMEKPLEGAYVLSEMQEEDLYNGKDLYSVIDPNNDYFIYNKSKDVYYPLVGDGFAPALFVQVIFANKEENIYTVRYNVWILPEDLPEDSE